MPESYTLRDVMWILIAAALVMMMQGGFTFLESGFVRAKNSINVAIKNFVTLCISASTFWLFGFAIMFGTSIGGIIGSSGFFFNEVSNPWLMSFFIFELVFCSITTTIISGAVAERMRFTGYLLATLLISGFIYPVLGHWVWGGLASGTAIGWLERIGFMDFAGSTMVHSTGGWLSLAGVLIIGPRIGRFDKDAPPIQGHSLPMATLGALLLWFGWFGFNGGSTLGVTANIPFIIANTILAGAFGGLITLLLSFWLYKRFDVGLLINGVLAGLVGITASANIVSQFSSVVIGLISGALSVGVTILLERIKIDDAVGAIPVHLAGGVWGTLAVALFGRPELFTNGLTRMEQLFVQLIGIGVTFVWAFGVGYALLWLANRFWGLRVSERKERLGLNIAEHDAHTALLDLLAEMDEQRRRADLTTRVAVEPHTEVGQIAAAYNNVLDAVARLVVTQDERDRLQGSIIKLLEEISDVADGDLRVEAEVTSDVTGAIADSFNFMIGQLREVIGNVLRTTVVVSRSANQVRLATEHLARGSEAQAAQIVGTSAAVDEMATSVQQVSDNARQSAEVAEQALQTARLGSGAVQNTIEGMQRIRQQGQETAKRIKRLGESSQEVGEIVQLMRSIAKRTNLLALNASLEAAAAGDAGRGFAVVAADVKRLSERSSMAAEQVAELIFAMQAETNEAVAAMEATTREVVEGSKLANEAGLALMEIESVSNQLAELSQSISLAATQQARGSETIAFSMNEIATVTQQTAVGTKDAAVAIARLALLADQLRSSVSTFKLPRSAAPRVIPNGVERVPETNGRSARPQPLALGD